jgi:hypothetical protein
MGVLIFSDKCSSKPAGFWEQAQGLAVKKTEVFFAVSLM